MSDDSERKEELTDEEIDKIISALHYWWAEKYMVPISYGELNDLEDKLQRMKKNK
jgi:hypothetical protein